jgi:hypothetical protein
MKKISTQDTIKRKGGQLVTSELDDDLVMMDIKNGSYISLNRTGRIIWQEIEQPLVVTDLIHRLTERYDINESVCTIETLQFLNKMAEQKLIDVN